MTNSEQCCKKGFCYAYCLAYTKEHKQTKRPWLPFPQNQCYCPPKTFAKCVGFVIQICRLTLFGRISMTFNKKPAFVATNLSAVQIAV